MKSYSFDIAEKYKVPVNIIEVFKRSISAGKKEEISMLEDDDKKMDKPSQEGRRNLNRKNLQEKLKNTLSAIPTTQTEGRRKEDEETDWDNKYGKPETQVLAYVSNLDSVSVVDILAGKEITKIPLALSPLDVVISPDKRYVYVTYPDNAALGVIAIRKNKEVAQVTLNEFPFTAGLTLGAAVSPDGRFIYTANYETSNISIVEATKCGWKVIGEIPLTKKPERIAITPNGRLAYVTLRDDNQIAVVDLLVNLQIKIIPAGTRPIAIAINKDYVGIAANPGSDDVTVFNAKLAESSLFSIPVGDRPPGVAFNPKGDIAYVTNRSGNSLSIIDIFQHKVIDTIPVGTQPIGVAVTKGGRFTVVANAEDNTVSIIDNAIRKVIYTVDVGLEPFFIKTVTLTKKCYS